MASQAEGKSLSELEREAEHTRADLIHTVDELHSRVSPEAIKQEVKAYARDTSSEWLRNLEQKARENPLQTVALGAGVAYPAWRFLINIPAPILLVGAGLALTRLSPPVRSAGGGSVKDNGGRRSEQLVDTLKQRAQGAASEVSQSMDGLKQRVAGVTADAASALNSGLNDLRNRTASAVSDTTDTVRNAANETLATASETVSEAYRGGMDVASRTADQVSETLRESKDNLIGAIESHPLIVGGIGLLFGAVIASALPVTQTENQLFGDASEDLKNRASDLAGQGFEAAKSAAEDVYEKSVARVQEQGLKPEGARKAVQDAGDKVQSLLHHGVDALSEPSKAGR